MREKKLTKAIKFDRLFICTAPIIFSLILFVVVKGIVGKENAFLITEAEGIENFKMLLGMWGTLLGFLITSISILLTLGDGKLINMLKQTGHYKTILITYVCCSLHLFIAVLIALICILLKWWNINIFALMCALCADTMMILAVCLYFLFVLVLRANE